MMTAKFVSAIALTLLSPIAVLPALAQTNVQTSVQLAQQNYGPQIDSFTVQPVDQLVPGDELVFTLQGTSNARATFTIGTVARNLPMQEIEPGVYEGRYTIRNQDQISENTRIQATLRRGDRTNSIRLQDPLIASNSSTNNSSTNNSSTGDRSDSRSSYNNNNQIPLEIISPVNNSKVSGNVDVTGRSTPNTTVDVSVRATTSVVGLLGVNRDIVKQTVQTDSRGNFKFSFNPTISVPGTRYEVSLSAANGNRAPNKETLILIQQ